MVFYHLVGGSKHCFHFIYGMSSFPLTNSIIFQDGYCTTNQISRYYIYSPPDTPPDKPSLTIVKPSLTIINPPDNPSLTHHFPICSIYLPHAPVKSRQAHRADGLKDICMAAGRFRSVGMATVLV